MPNLPFSVRLLRSIRTRTRLATARARGSALRAGSLLGLLEAGPDLLVGRGVDLDIYGTLRLGAGVHLDDGCRLSVAPGATLVLEDGAYVGLGTVIRAASSVHIGERTLIAEHCSIRDSDHPLDAEARARDAHSPATPVVIGARSWLGAGVRVLRGTVLGEATVVAANAVVRGTFPPHSLLAGVPAKLKRNLQAKGAQPPPAR